MPKQIDFKTFQKVEGIKAEINKLYSKLDNMTDDLYGDYGESSFYFEIEEDENGCRFARIEIVDNLKKLKRGELIHHNVYTKPVELVAKRLKGEPKNSKKAS